MSDAEPDPDDPAEADEIEPKPVQPITSANVAPILQPARVV